MKNPPNSSEQALEDYFNDLLSEPAPRKDVDAAAPTPPFEEPPQLRPAARLAHLPTRMAAAQLSSSSLPSTPLPVPPTLTATPALSAAPGVTGPATPLRAYAEPIRTLNLRMPLPALAPQRVVEPIARPAAIDIPAAVPVAKMPAPPAADPVPAAERPPGESPREQPQPAAPRIEMGDASADVPVSESAAQASMDGAPAPWLDNGRPAWAQQPFECLLFSVGGLGLAAPLAELGSIYMLDTEALTAIFGQAGWFMGLLPVKGGFNVRTIDGAQVVMPERYAPEMRERYRYVISLHGSDWGLAVDAVADSVILQPDDVRWRGQRSKRPWLAGTVVTRMCALLDVAQLVWMFENQDGKRSGPRH